MNQTLALFAASVSIVLIGDMQNVPYSGGAPYPPDAATSATFLQGMADWINNNAVTYSIIAAQSLGDNLEGGDAAAAARLKTNLYDRITVPLHADCGNHDGCGINGVNTLISAWTTGVLTSPQGLPPAQWFDPTNYYWTINAGHRELLFVIVQYCPSDAQFAWALSVMQAFPNREIIYIEHLFGIGISNNPNAYYIKTTGDAACVGAHSPADRWATLKTIRNLAIIGSGHESSGSFASTTATFGNYASGPLTSDDGHTVLGVYTDFERVDYDDGSKPWTVGSAEKAFLTMVTLPDPGTGNAEVRVISSNSGHWVAPYGDSQPGSFGVPLRTNPYAPKIQGIFPLPNSGPSR